MMNFQPFLLTRHRGETSIRCRRSDLENYCSARSRRENPAAGVSSLARSRRRRESGWASRGLDSRQRTLQTILASARGPLQRQCRLEGRTECVLARKPDDGEHPVERPVFTESRRPRELNVSSFPWFADRRFDQSILQLPGLVENRIGKGRDERMNPLQIAKDA
jgi:hypothetical protein